MKIHSGRTVNFENWIGQMTSDSLRYLTKMIDLLQTWLPENVSTSMIMRGEYLIGEVFFYIWSNIHSLCNVKCTPTPTRYLKCIARSKCSSYATVRIPMNSLSWFSLMPCILGCLKFQNLPANKIHTICHVHNMRFIQRPEQINLQEIEPWRTASLMI